GYDRDGGYAELAVADERYCLELPAQYPAEGAAPLLCAGLIGYRALRFAGDAEALGLYGFGSSAHIIAQVARHEGRRVFAFTRPGDEEGQTFARSLGVEWAADSDEAPPEELDAAIIFAPVGALVPVALRAVRKAGEVVCAGIHMSDIPSFPYELLWGERVVRSVANLTRRDGEEFLALAPQVPVRTEVETFRLEDVNEAPEQLVDPQVLRLDAVERRERAPEDVVQAAELARPLDRDEVDRLLDHADHRVIAASVAADRTDFLLGQVPALVAEAHTLLDVLDRRRERKRLVQRSLQDGAEGSPNEDHIAFALDQDKAAERAREGGVQVVGPRDFYWGRAAYLRDPDGRAVELQADS